MGCGAVIRVAPLEKVNMRYVVVMIALMLSAIVFCIEANAAEYVDIRCCVEVKRYKNGKIIRSGAAVEAFERMYPLPAGFNRDDYQVDHAVPLVCGGVDEPVNMIWMHKSAKTCAEDFCQDRHERLTMCGIKNK